MRSTRRAFLRVLITGVPAVAMVACAPGATDPCDVTAGSTAGCDSISANAGLNQYDILNLFFNGEIPPGRNFSFAVLRGEDFVEPGREEYTIGPAPEGAANERSFEPDATELYIFKDGEIAVFTEVDMT